MSNNYRDNTVKLRRDKPASVRTTTAYRSSASRVYNYELMLQLYYITKQEAALPKHSKTRATLLAD